MFSKKLLRTTNYHHTKSCLVPIYIFCIIIILSFTMTVGILMLLCGLGIRNTNTFYTFRCPQLLEMIRLYLIIYTKNLNWNETWLCVVIIGCTKKLLWKNQDRPCWIQRENNDVNVYATSKSSLVWKKDISVQQICFKFSWHIKVLYQRVSVIFVFISNVYYHI